MQAVRKNHEKNNRLFSFIPNLRVAVLIEIRYLYGKIG